MTRIAQKLDSMLCASWKAPVNMNRLSHLIHSRRNREFATQAQCLWLRSYNDPNVSELFFPTYLP